MYSIGISQHFGRCKTRLLSFPHKRGVHYNNAPADVYAHYAEPLIFISLQQLIPNHSGNDFRHAREHQTIWETTFAMRKNSKPFAEWFAGSPQAPNPLKSELWEAI